MNPRPELEQQSSNTAARNSFFEHFEFPRCERSADQQQADAAKVSFIICAISCAAFVCGVLLVIFMP